MTWFVVHNRSHCLFRNPEIQSQPDMIPSACTIPTHSVFRRARVPCSYQFHFDRWDPATVNTRVNLQLRNQFLFFKSRNIQELAEPQTNPHLSDQSRANDVVHVVNSLPSQGRVSQKTNPKTSFKDTHTQSR